MPDEKWYAVFTKYKCEKYVRDQLLSKHFEVYVPILNEVKRYKSKTRKIERPLIPSYVFVKMDIAERIQVLEIQYVRGILKLASEFAEVKEEEIEILKRVVGDKSNIQLAKDNEVMIVGDKVEIVEGNLLGLKGYIVEIKKKKSFMISIDSLDKNLLLEINLKYLKKF